MVRSSSLYWTRIRYCSCILLIIYKYQPVTLFQVPGDGGPDSDDGLGTGSLVLISLGVIVLVALLIASVFKIRPDEHFKKWWENRSHTGIDYSAEDSL